MEYEIIIKVTDDAGDVSYVKKTRKMQEDDIEDAEAFGHTLGYALAGSSERIARPELAIATAVRTYIECINGERADDELSSGEQVLVRASREIVAIYDAIDATMQELPD